MNTPQEFGALLAALRDLPPGAGAALATLTRTRGSTFRRAGARMLVLADGSLVRGLSAGCPEQDIARHAHAALVAGQARLLRYDAVHNGDVLMEMGCGGELEVLIEALRDRADWQFAESIGALLQTRRSGVLATLVRRGDAFCARPAHWLGTDQQIVLDELDDPALSAALLAATCVLPARHKPGLLSIPLARGSAELFVERLAPPLRALLFGINASAVALAQLLLMQGWQVRLIDHRALPAEPGALPSHLEPLVCPPEAVAHRLQGDARSFAVVMTHNLERDIAYLQALRSVPLAYLGAVGARARAARLFEASGLGPVRLRCPAGLDLGSETPEEIALSIAAEMLAAANTTSAAPLSALQVPIHR